MHRHRIQYRLQVIDILRANGVLLANVMPMVSIISSFICYAARRMELGDALYKKMQAFILVAVPA